MNILIIDNNQEDTTYIKELLIKNSKGNFSVCQANTLNEGIHLLKKEPVTIILCDLFLPDAEDLNDLDKLHILFPHVPVIVFTRLGHEELGTNAVSRGAYDYLVKGSIKSFGLIRSIQKSIAFHSLKIKTEQLSLYIKDNLETLKRMIHLGERVEISPNFHSILKKLTAKVKFLSITTNFSLFLIHKKQNQLYLTAHNLKNLHDDTPLSISGENSIMFETIRGKKTIRVSEVEQTLPGNTKERTYIESKTICIPLMSGQEVLGVLNLNNYSDTIYSHEFLIKFKLLVYMHIIALKDNFISLNLEELSLTDELSGLYNSRYLLWELNREIRRVQRYRGNLSILHIDIENFKNINDTYGYKTGDVILRKISDQLKKLIRTTDLVGRYSGEEFIALLTETNNKGAYILNRRITYKINQSGIDIGLKTPIKIKVTIHSAEYDFKIKNAKEFVNYLKTLVEKKETIKEISGEEPKETDKKMSEQEERAKPTTVHAQNVRVYFIEPLELISVVIDTLVKMGFESYQVDSIDKIKLLKVLDKYDRNVIFICISNQNQLDNWIEYIDKIEQLQEYTIQVGAFIYSRIDLHDSKKFLERNIAVIKFSDIQSDTLGVLKKILFYFEAKGRRGFVRVEAVAESKAFFTIEGERKVIGAKIINFSEQFFTCHFEKEDIHHIVHDRYFIKVMLRLKGMVVQISTKVLTTKKGDPQYCIMQICSALYKNKKVTFTNGVNKETKDKLHRYIRHCLKESIKKKLNMVQD